MSSSDLPPYERSSNGRFDLNHNGKHDSDDEIEKFDEEDEDHEHVYNNIVQTRNLSAYAEAIHEVITLEFHDRGLSLDLSYAEALELGKVLAEVVSFLNQSKETK